MKLGMYIIPHEAISMVHFINLFHQYYQHYSLSDLRQNLNIASTPVPNFMEVGMYIMPHEAISTAYSIHSSISNTNITAHKICCGSNRNVT
jgi:hypothetical protein